MDACSCAQTCSHHLPRALRRRLSRPSRPRGTRPRCILRTPSRRYQPLARVAQPVSHARLRGGIKGEAARRKAGSGKAAAAAKAPWRSPKGARAGASCGSRSCSSRRIGCSETSWSSARSSRMSALRLPRAPSTWSCVAPTGRSSARADCRRPSNGS